MRKEELSDKQKEKFKWLLAADKNGNSNLYCGKFCKTSVQARMRCIVMPVKSIGIKNKR